MSLVNLNLNLNLDRTANKIAFCSAVVAGTIYIGYSVARTAFSRRRVRYRGTDDDDDHLPTGRSVFLRRLSQTTQTDALLGDIDFSGNDESQGSRLIIRAKSVQERIRELNVRARQFADAVTAIQGNSGGHSHHGHPRANGVTGRSLQVTPWGSPRMLSPIDVRHIVPEGEVDRPERYSPAGSPKHSRYWTRGGSFKSGRRMVDFELQGETRFKESERLWADERKEINSQLSEILSNQHRELSQQEASYLVAALNSEDAPLLGEILASLANYAAFSSNQDKLRDAGLIGALSKLLMYSTRQIKQRVCPVVANMALNEKNNAEMCLVTVSLSHLFLTTTLADPALLTACLAALTNIAVLSTCQKEMKPVLHKAFCLLDEGHWNSDGISLQSLKLLINLSCNEEMIHSLLAAQAPSRLIYLLDMSMPENALLRVTTLLANIATAAKRLNIDPLRLPAEDKAAAPETLYAAVFGLSTIERYKRKALVLSERHSNPDVSEQAQKLWAALAE